MENNCKYCCMNFYYFIIDIKDKIIDIIFELSENKNYKYKKVNLDNDIDDDELSSKPIVEWDLV